jgi:hypothetical protein
MKKCCRCGANMPPTTRDTRISMVRGPYTWYSTRGPLCSGCRTAIVLMINIEMTGSLPKHDPDFFPEDN